MGYVAPDGGNGRWVPATLMEARPDEVCAWVGALPDTPRAVTITDPGPDELRLVAPAAVAEAWPAFGHPSNVGGRS